MSAALPMFGAEPLENAVGTLMLIDNTLRKRQSCGQILGIYDRH